MRSIFSSTRTFISVSLFPRRRVSRGDRGEAMYADMGHFGRVPIRVAWFAVALPSLVLNYFGQAALLITDPTALDHPFYQLAPDWLHFRLLASRP